VENFAPSDQSGSGVGPPAERRPSGRWSFYVASAEPRSCGLETAWRGGTAHLSLALNLSFGEPGLVITLHDAGWDLTAPLSGAGEVFVDGKSAPASLEHRAGSDPTILSGRLARAAGGPALLAALKGGTLLWLASPLGRTPALSLAGSRAAADALARCLDRGPKDQARPSVGLSSGPKRGTVPASHWSMRR